MVQSGPTMPRPPCGRTWRSTARHTSSPRSRRKTASALLPMATRARAGPPEAAPLCQRRQSSATWRTARTACRRDRSFPSDSRLGTRRTRTRRLHSRTWRTVAPLLSHRAHGGGGQGRRDWCAPDSGSACGRPAGSTGIRNAGAAEYRTVLAVVPDQIIHHQTECAESGAHVTIEYRVCRNSYELCCLLVCSLSCLKRLEQNPEKKGVHVHLPTTTCIHAACRNSYACIPVSASLQVAMHA